MVSDRRRQRHDLLFAIAASLALALTASACGKKSSHHAPQASATTVGSAPSPWAGTWSGTFTSTPEAVAALDARRLPVPLGGFTEATDAVTRAGSPVTFSWIIDATVAATGVVSGTFTSADLGLVDIPVTGTYVAATRTIDVTCTDGDFVFTLTGTVTLGDGTPSSLGDSVSHYTASAGASVVDGTSVATQRFFGRASGDWTSHPFGAPVSGYSAWTHRDVLGQQVAYLMATQPETIAWSDGVVTYDVATWRTEDVGSPEGLRLWLARAYDGGIYAVREEPLNGTQVIEFTEPRLYAKAVLTTGDHWPQGLDVERSVVSVSASTGHGFDGCISLRDSESDTAWSQTNLYEPSLGLASWTSTSPDATSSAWRGTALPTVVSGAHGTIVGCWTPNAPANAWGAVAGTTENTVLMFFADGTYFMWSDGGGETGAEFGRFVWADDGTLTVSARAEDNETLQGLIGNGPGGSNVWTASVSGGTLTLDNGTAYTFTRNYDPDGIVGGLVPGGGAGLSAALDAHYVSGILAFLADGHYFYWHGHNIPAKDEVRGAEHGTWSLADGVITATSVLDQDHSAGLVDTGDLDHTSQWPVSITTTGLILESADDGAIYATRVMPLP